MIPTLFYTWVTILGFLSSFIFLPTPLLSAESARHGKVVGVTDGDTIEILEQELTLKVRLAEIDAPEKRQAFGAQSKKTLSELVFSKEVRVIERNHDRYGRLVGTVYVGDQNVNAEMVQRGMAWVYRRYATDVTLFQLEEEAKAERRGLWIDPQAIPPWQYRHGTDRIPKDATRMVTNEGSPIIGNAKSGIYHWSGCPNYHTISSEHRVLFTSKAEAESAGFRAAKNCP